MRARRWSRPIAEQNDELLEKYLAGEPIATDELKAALRAATINRIITPVLCGSAFKNKGVQPLLDAVVDYLPSPLDIPPMTGINPDSDETEERLAADDEPFAALIFKIMTDPFVGQLAFFRVYSGHVDSGTAVLQRDQGQHRAHRAPAQDAREQAGRDQGSVGGRHRRGRRAAQRHDGRHDLRQGQADRPR